MKQNETPAMTSASNAKAAPVKKPVDQDQVQDKQPTANALGKGIDRPGFDIGGSSGETHAGSGLGLGEDAFETSGDRRLPGRRLDNHTTIPRWSAPASVSATRSDEKPAKPKAPVRPEDGTSR